MPAVPGQFPLAEFVDFEEQIAGWPVALVDRGRWLYFEGSPPSRAWLAREVIGPVHRRREGVDVWDCSFSQAWHWPLPAGRAWAGILCDESSRRQTASEPLLPLWRLGLPPSGRLGLDYFAHAGGFVLK